jgi:uncharacterized protein
MFCCSSPARPTLRATKAAQSTPLSAPLAAPSRATLGDSVASASSGATCAGPGPEARRPDAKNISAEPLAPCPAAQATGFYRNGYCNTGPDDRGVHVVCAKVDAQFLAFSRSQGNDLVTPSAGFPGLKPGDAWCLCAARWRDAYAAGVAPEVIAEATDARALDFVERRALLGRATANTF